MGKAAEQLLYELGSDTFSFNKSGSIPRSKSGSARSPLSRRSPRLNIKIIPEASPVDDELTPDAPNEGITDIQSMPNTLRDVEMAQQQKGFMSRFNFHTPRFLNAFKK